MNLPRLDFSLPCRLAAILLLIAGAPAHAGDRITATGGLSDVEGAGGGGLTPWATITGYGADDQVGGNAHLTHIAISDFRLDSAGVAIGFNDRIELSLDRLTLGLGSTVPGDYIREDVVGLKLRLAGDAVYEPDRAMPQVAVGVEYKQNLDAAVPRALGARRDADFDYYAAATKLWFAALAGRNVVGNLTLRATRANQFGLLGFGGDRSDDYHLEPEGSLGILLRDNLATGIEFRRKPDNLSVFAENRCIDLFAAWFPVKDVSLTAAWTDLGRIADKRNQHGLFLQIQLHH